MALLLLVHSQPCFPPAIAYTFSSQFLSINTNITKNVPVCQIDPFFYVFGSFLTCMHVMHLLLDNHVGNYEWGKSKVKKEDCAFTCTLVLQGTPSSVEVHHELWLSHTLLPVTVTHMLLSCVVIMFWLSMKSVSLPLSSLLFLPCLLLLCIFFLALRTNFVQYCFYILNVLYCLSYSK